MKKMLRPWMNLKSCIYLTDVYTDIVPELHLFTERAHNLVSYLVYRRVAILAARRLCPALIQFGPQSRDLVAQV